MRAIKRPLAATSAAVLLALSFSACGDDGDDPSDDKSSESTESTESTDATDGTDPTGATDGATDATSAGGADASTREFCAEVSNIIAVSSSVAGDEPNEAEWKKIQDAYAQLREVGPPDDIPAEEREGFDIAIDAITGLSYAEAEKAFGDEDGSDDIPGVSEEDNAKAEAFYAWSATACPNAVGGGAATPSE